MNHRVKEEFQMELFWKLMAIYIPLGIGAFVALCYLEVNDNGRN
jgi:hypothetical protein